MPLNEYPEQDIGQGRHSWWWRWKRSNGKWGGIRIDRLASFEDRFGVVRIRGYGSNIDKDPRLDVYVTDAGKRIRVYLNDQEMSVGGDS